MGVFNAQICSDSRGLEGVMGMHGMVKGTGYGELFIEMCAANNLLIGGSIFPHKSDQSTANQIDHIAISRKWRGSLLDVRDRGGAGVSSDHHLLIGSIRLGIATVSAKALHRQEKFDTPWLNNPVVSARNVKAHGRSNTGAAVLDSVS